ncbi:ATP-binding cassette domain-containing protein [Floccifex porci]|uniref:ATP-binding cassette domain-containing protein n=1 Tax=Floccifex porci TaxID=2606629 RepID=UPI00197F5B8B|nr:ATP-binding cassette domain-containing protein [Floccifex porci]
MRKEKCIVGKSGAGKTTLLSVLTELAQSDSGSIYYDGKDIKTINKYQFRNQYIGVIFQSFNLITKFTALENVILSINSWHQRLLLKAAELLKSVGLDTDEPTRNLGSQTQKEIMDIFRQLADE